MRDFKKYDIWKLSHLFTLDIYKITNKYPKEEVQSYKQTRQEKLP